MPLFALTVVLQSGRLLRRLLPFATPDDRDADDATCYDLTGQLAWLVDQSGVNWQVDWPSGWESAVDADGNIVLRSSGQQAAVAGSEIGVTGSAIDQQQTCPGAMKMYAATAIVYYTFGPLN